MQRAGNCQPQIKKNLTDRIYRIDRMKWELHCNLQHQLFIRDNRRDPGLRLLLLDQSDLRQVLHIIGDILHVPLGDRSTRRRSVPVCSTTKLSQFPLIIWYCPSGPVLSWFAAYLVRFDLDIPEKFVDLGMQLIMFLCWQQIHNMA